MESLASLPVGTAWVLEPGAEPALFQQVKVRTRRTFNSSATPKPGERRIEPRVLAAVDREALVERMAETVERAAENDPDELRRRLAAAARKQSEAEQKGADLARRLAEIQSAGGASAVEEVLAVYMAAKQEEGFSCDVVDEVRALENRPALDTADLEQLAGLVVW